MDIFNNDLERLNFEDFIWVIFIGLILLNIVGDNFQKEFIKTNNKNDESKANNIFLFVLLVTLFIYLYFFVRNFNALERASEENKKLFFIKLLGSSFLIAGIICLIYFQFKQVDFIGTPAL